MHHLPNNLMQRHREDGHQLLYLTEFGPNGPELYNCCGSQPRHRVCKVVSTPLGFLSAAEKLKLAWPLLSANLL